MSVFVHMKGQNILVKKVLNFILLINSFKFIFLVSIKGKLANELTDVCNQMIAVIRNSFISL